MMAQHSVEGYIALLMTRSKHTLVVEGPSDVEVIARVLSQVRSDGAPVSSRIVVDQVGMVKPVNAVTGNRQMLEHIHRIASDYGARLTALVDREFREFDLDPHWRDLQADHVEPVAGLFWTRGHSIENYLLTDQYVTKYIAYRIAAELGNSFEDEVLKYLPGIRRWICAFSVAMMRQRLLGRSKALPGEGHWILGAAGLELKLDVLAGVLVQRGASSEAATAVDAETRRLLPLLTGASDDFVRLASHGHILMEGTWSAVAELAKVFGVSAGSSKDLVRDCEERLRYLAQLWSNDISVDMDKCESPRALWARLVSLA